MPNMRKDVKLGFAIGGVLLAVLIVYVLVVPGSDNKPAPQAKGPTAEPVVAPNPTTAPSQPQAQAPVPTVLHTPTTAPDVFAPPPKETAKGETQWNKLLDGDISLAAAVSTPTSSHVISDPAPLAPQHTVTPTTQRTP